MHDCMAWIYVYVNWVLNFLFQLFGCIPLHMWPDFKNLSFSLCIQEIQSLNSSYLMVPISIYMHQQNLCTYIIILFKLPYSKICYLVLENIKYLRLCNNEKAYISIMHGKIILIIKSIILITIMDLYLDYLNYCTVLKIVYNCII